MTNLTAHNNVPAADSPAPPAAAGLPHRSPLAVLMCSTFMIVLDGDARVFNESSCGHEKTPGR